MECVGGVCGWSVWVECVGGVWVECVGEVCGWSVWVECVGGVCRWSVCWSVCVL